MLKKNMLLDPINLSFKFIENCLNWIPAYYHCELCYTIVYCLVKVYEELDLKNKFISAEINPLKVVGSTNTAYRIFEYIFRFSLISGSYENIEYIYLKYKQKFWAQFHLHKMISNSKKYPKKINQSINISILILICFSNK